MKENVDESSSSAISSERSCKPNRSQSVAEIHSEEELSVLSRRVVSDVAVNKNTGDNNGSSVTFLSETVSSAHVRNTQVHTDKNSKN
jgi:hypothetical protein